MGAKSSRPTCPLIRWCNTRRNGSGGERVGGAAYGRVGDRGTGERERERERLNAERRTPTRRHADTPLADTFP
jgi:hypothetical protein